MSTLVTSTPAKMAAVSEMPGKRSARSSGGRWLRCRYTWSFSGPHPRPSRISSVMLRDTTSRDARSLAVGAYLGAKQHAQFQVGPTTEASSTCRFWDITNTARGVLGKIDGGIVVWSMGEQNML